jgi:N5-(cytidine 5'-diphosphoramidyl)-L-glutamine hydrolase
MRRIGLTQRVDVVSAYRERRDGLDQNWARLVSSLDLAPVPLCNEVSDPDRYLEALGLSGIILTGGNDLSYVSPDVGTAPERDRFEHHLLTYCANRNLPVLGVCRGFQLLNVHHGGGLVPLRGHVARQHPVQIAEQPPFFALNTGEVHSYHKYGINATCLSPSFLPVAWADDGTIEAAVHQTLPHYAVMWHPEREWPFRAGDLSLIETIFRGSLR